ncbi:lipopolysaccharide biosynthesis protein [Geodermatophilus sp. SYSU D01045]
MTDVDVRIPTPAPEAGEEALPPPRGRGRLRRHLAEPFARNAYSLVLNTGLTGVLGVGYWLVAARTYGESDVGRGSVTISVMTLLSGLVALSLYGTLACFIGPSGRRTGRFVLGTYVLTAVATAVLATGFLLTLPLWGPSYVHLSGFTTGAWFVAAVVAAALFTLQDGVLTGLRRSGWVPVENAVFGIAKLALLVVLASRDPRDGVWLSWVIPMALLLLPVNGLIFGRLIPRHRRTVPPTHVPPTVRQVGRFLAGDYLGALCMLAAFQLVPVLVAAAVPLYSFGYFYIAWTVGSLLATVGTNMASSLTVEGVYDPGSLSANCRAAITRTVALVLTAAVAIALVAPYGLGLLGKGYLDAVPLLQLLAAAALPVSLVEIYVGVLRAQNASARIARIQVLRVVLMLCAVLAATQLDGLFGDLVPLTLTRVGIAVLLYQSVLAALVLPRLWKVAGTARSTARRGGLHRLPVPTAPVLDDHLVAGSSAPVPVTATRIRTSDRAAAGRLGGAAPVLLALTTVAGLVAYALPLRSVDLRQINGYGLVSVLPLASIAGLVLIGSSFLAGLALRRARTVLLGLQLVAWVVCLHGLPVLLHSMPRFPTAWTHLGFIEFITRTGTVAPSIDARFSWAGFFGLFSFLSDARHWQDMAWVLRLTPVVSNLLYLLPVVLILTNLRANWRAKWLTLWLFAVFNWVGQDYFSPQGLAYFLYLTLVALLITWFRPAARTRRPGVREPRARSWLHPPTPGELPARPTGRSERVVLLVLVLVVFTFTTMSHQLTPFLMIGAATALVLVGRCVLRTLPVLMFVIVAAWISFMAVGYWSGHLHELLGGLGSFGTNVSSSVQGRTGDSGAQHLLVLKVRVALALGAWGLAAAGALRRRRQGFDDRVVLALLASPALGFGLQSYGGEIALRVFVFSLPAVCFLAAQSFFPEAGSRRRIGRLLGVPAALLCVPLLVGGFLVARFGNEGFEYVRPGEITATDVVLDHSTGLTSVLWPAREPPATLPSASFVTSYSQVDRVFYSSVIVPPDPGDVGPVVNQMREHGPGAYLLTTRSQEAELVLAEGFPQDWGDRFRASMAASPDVRVLVSNPDAAVYVLATPPPGPVEDPPPVSTGVGAWTPLTGVGLTCLVALAGALCLRELRRLTGRARAPMLTVVTLPLAFGLLVVVLERAVLLA